MNRQIRAIVEQSFDDGRWRRAEMISNLEERERIIADRIRMAGQQFGLYPEIVAEVLAELELGATPSSEERALIRHNFVNLMDRLGGGGTV